MATWDPRPGRFGPDLADPNSSPSSQTATTVTPGGFSTHQPRASSSGEPDREGIGLTGLDDLGERREELDPVVLGDLADDHAACPSVRA